MRTSIVFDFKVDKENKTIRVEREFEAPLSNVWAAWTQKEILDKWWAPKPWKANTKKLDFKEGGSWLYAMEGPDGHKDWCRADFRKIVPYKRFTYVDSFCDENGNFTNTFPMVTWNVEFKEKQNSTLVNVEIKFDKASDVEKYIETGFKEGFTAGLENLDEVLGS